MNLQYTEQFNFSLGVQDATTFLLKDKSELTRGINLRFTETVGAFERRPGFIRVGDTYATDKSPQGGIIAKFTTGNKRIVATNNSNDTATIIKVQDSGTGAWSTLSGVPTYPASTVLFFKYYLDEIFVSGFNPATGDPVQPCNIDKTLNVSTTRNLLHCPWPYFFEEYLGRLHAANVLIGSTRYKDRDYMSSPPFGALTYMQGAQNNVYSTETLIGQVPALTDYSLPFGTALASTEVNTSNRAWQAFDRDTGDSRWIANTTTGWVRFDFGSGNSKVIRYYSITSQNDEYRKRDLKDWTLQGSNDGSSWTTLDTRTSEAIWAQNETRTYATTNTTAYRYYRINITANQSGAGGPANDYVGLKELQFYTVLEANRLIEFKIDSARYTKPGDIIDVYAAGTETKKFTVTINTVDKVKNTITIYPIYNTNGTFDSTNDWLAFTSGQEPSLTDIATGDPIRFTATGGMPTGLTSLQTYYAIRVTGDTTKIRLAATKEQALINDYINFTTNGSGTIQLEKMYSVADNDELWLTGTKGRLNLFWNTDYPNEENAEFLHIKPGNTGASQITGIRPSSNRIFIFTQFSSSRYDGGNLITFSRSVGCISQRSLANIDDDWLLWMDAKGNIRARNENQGVQENISRAIRKPWLSKLTQDQRKAVNVGIVDQVAKFYLGTIGGQHIRVCYDFEANTWSPERLAYPALIQDVDDYTGELKPYFLSSNSRLYMDETGNLDDDKVIPFEGGTGGDIFGTPRRKKFYGLLLFSDNCNGTRIVGSVDGGQAKTVGTVDGKVCFIKFNETGDNVLPTGVSFDWEIKGAVKGDPQAVYGAVVYWATVEDVPSEQQAK